MAFNLAFTDRGFLVRYQVDAKEIRKESRRS